MTENESPQERQSRMMFIAALTVFVVIVAAVAVWVIVTTDREQGFTSGQAEIEHVTAQFVEAANDDDTAKMRELTCSQRHDDLLGGMPTPPITYDSISDLEVDGRVATGQIEFFTGGQEDAVPRVSMRWLDDDGWKLC